MKTVWKINRPFRYDLNQIPYDYTVEVRNRFKGLDLIDRVPDELWMELHDIAQETVIKTIPMEKKCQKAKGLSGEALQLVVKRRDHVYNQTPHPPEILRGLKHTLCAPGPRDPTETETEL